MMHKIQTILTILSEITNEPTAAIIGINILAYLFCYFSLEILQQFLVFMYRKEMPLIKNIISRFTHSKTAALRPLPIERALKTDILTIAAVYTYHQQWWPPNIKSTNKEKAKA